MKVPIDGMSGTEDSLKISCAWAIQHYFAGKTYQTIAEENKSSHPAVMYRVKFFIDHLPAPEMGSTVMSLCASGSQSMVLSFHQRRDTGVTAVWHWIDRWGEVTTSATPRESLPVKFFSLRSDIGRQKAEGDRHQTKICGAARAKTTSSGCTTW